VIWSSIDRREGRRLRRVGRGVLRVEQLEARRLLATVTVLDETFAAVTTGSSTSTTGSSTAWSGSADWPNVTKAFQAGGAVRLGTSSVTGSITSRPVDLSGGPVTVSFGVKGWTTVEGSLVVTVSGQPAQTVSYVATMSSNFETKSLTFSAGQAAATISFATTAKRAFLDNILVTVESGPPLVHAIRGLAWDDADGDGLRAGEPGLAGRTIYLDLDNDGVLGAGEPTATTATDGSYAFADLSAGTYTVAQIVPEGWEQTAPPVAEAGAGGRLLRSLAGIAPIPAAADFVGPLPVRRHMTRLIPNDPLFSQQWHLRNTGQSGGTAGEDIRVTTAWDRFRGSGVVIGIVDDGLQSTHPDLSGRYVSSLSYDFNGNDTNPAPGAGDDHGTAVAGIAAATGNNGIGVSGVAPAASLAGLRLVAAATTDAEEAEALNHRMQDIHIYNNSWGPDDTGDNLEAPGPFTLAALQNGVENGRGGLGSIYVWAAGNGLEAKDNVNYDGYANSRYTIAVTAVDDDGRQAYYAEPGAPILVAAPGGGRTADITTTDRTGSAGYASGDYATDFGGTSAATPVVSGVVALMLEANPELSWRDVQHVLVESARKNHAVDAGWSLNGAGKWVNHRYGFGMVDATAAVSMAETWTPVGAEVSAASGTINVGRSIPDNSVTGITSSFTVGGDISVEWVEVVLSASHTYRGDLEVILVSPSGTQSVLAETRSDAGANYSNWRFTSARHWGEEAAGAWSLRVADRSSGDTGSFNSWSLNVYGTGRVAGPPPGARVVTLAGGLDATGVDFGSRSLTLPADPVRVAGVYFQGSGWDAGYLARSPFTAVAGTPLGWQLPDGAAQVADGSAASWTNVDTISVRFDQPIAQPAAAAIRLVLATDASSQQILPTATPTLLAGGTVARWILPAAYSVLGRGRYVLAMAAGGITNAAGTTTLDGEWTTSASTFAAGSGDGTAGGDFEFAFHVLPGDANGNGVANASDLSAIRTKLLGPLSTPLGSDADYRFDVNGSNSLSSADISQARAQLTSAFGTRP